ncbi:MAG: ACP S-malonyltransferase [Alphaproteobacteria bacterium]|nr:ACP S-malonyltransferase [Alphaproteobacteria bacterium]
MSKQRAVVICPGRGTYNKEELGYFHKYHADRLDLLTQIDELRAAQKQVSISELDSASEFIMKEHTRGDNASALIYACAYADFLSIDRDKYDVVAVTGNSMGWYIALSCAGAVNFKVGANIINTMGTFMQEALIGGQLIYTCVGENWQAIEGAQEEIEKIISQIDGLYASIYLGGMFVFGGTEEALKELEKTLEPRDRFPFRLINHAAFHTPLQTPISEKAFAHFDREEFQVPVVPMVDGRGFQWSNYSSDVEAMFEYTFGHQVIQAYDFTRAVQNSLKEYAPDKIIILGPGTTLGGAVAQSLIAINWHDIDSKDAFIERQKSDPFILSMGMEEQRDLVI